MNKGIAHEPKTLSDKTSLREGGLHVMSGGTSTLSSDPQRAGASVAVVAGGESSVVDAGPGSARALASSKAPISSIQAVLFTHTHSARYGELSIVGEISGRTAPLTVDGPPGGEQLVAGFEQACAIDHANRPAQHPGSLYSDSATCRPALCLSQRCA